MWWGGGDLVWWGGGPGQGVEVLVRGMSSPPRTGPPPPVTYPMMHFRVTAPPVVGQTDASENITFARYATRAVIMWFCVGYYKLPLWWVYTGSD